MIALPSEVKEEEEVSDAVLSRISAGESVRYCDLVEDAVALATRYHNIYSELEANDATIFKKIFESYVDKFCGDKAHSENDSSLSQNKLDKKKSKIDQVSSNTVICDRNALALITADRTQPNITDKRHSNFESFKTPITEECTNSIYHLKQATLATDVTPNASFFSSSCALKPDIATQVLGLQSYENSHPGAPLAITPPSTQQFFANEVENRVSNVSLHSNKQMKILGNANKKCVNILLIGQSGVGKSTWINSFANYMFYGTLEEAIKAETPICVIPSQFTVTDKNNQRHTILLGNDENENLSDQADSATQDARVYSFEKNECFINFIDTPGLNDTRGKEQDRLNMQKILEAVASFDELHAICFLFKPNENKLTDSFRFSINHILRNLNKRALNNACFIFTNARSSFFKPSRTKIVLETYFGELNIKEHLSVKITNDNMFFLDNEGFRYLCKYFSGAKFDTTTPFQDLSTSWERSSQEINRFLIYAASLCPHDTSETLSISKTRKWSQQLVISTIEVSEIVQINMSKLNQRIQELESIQSSIKNLQMQAQKPLITVEIKRLNKPKIVCINNRCVRRENIEGHFRACHTDGKLASSDPRKQTEGTGICQNCGCSTKEHHRRFFEHKLVEKIYKIEIPQNAFAYTNDAATIKKLIISQFRKMIKNFEEEFSFIINAMALYSLFLLHNGIGQFDIFENHIKDLLEQETKMARDVQHYDDKKYNRLSNLLKIYQNVVAKTAKERNIETVSFSEILNLREKLCKLPQTGSTIAELFDIHNEADKEDDSKILTLYNKDSLQNLIERSIRWVKNAKDHVISFLPSLEVIHESGIQFSGALMGP